MIQGGLTNHMNPHLKDKALLQLVTEKEVGQMCSHWPRRKPISMWELYMGATWGRTADGV